MFSQVSNRSHPWDDSVEMEPERGTTLYSTFYPLDFRFIVNVPTVGRKSVDPLDRFKVRTFDLILLEINDYVSMDRLCF